MASSKTDPRIECFVFPCVAQQHDHWFRTQGISHRYFIRICRFPRHLSFAYPIRCCSQRAETPKKLVPFKSNVDNNNNNTGDGIVRSLDIFSNLFPLWILLGSCVAFIRPAYFIWFKGPHIIWTLALVMLAMGLTLDLQQLVQVTRNPYPILLGALAQYTIMPVLGYLVSRLFALPRYFAVGVCLVACCPGGTASNLVCYLAEANVALSVLMTTVTTLISVIVTPWLMLLVAGTLVPIQGYLCVSCFLGLSCSHLW
ncbi:Probable sodium/metabolite cotransporter BASS1, chloroplastic [Galdieria sulphuraria]|nr:Probable sodium/metabolite cotransporter BASS1, chloroplastic [Galdieria sulphuraria]